MRPDRIVARHLDALTETLDVLRAADDVLASWAAELADQLAAGARLLVAGNGGSAAEAQHLSAELLGRYREERPPFAVIALHADTSTLTALGNDYGFAEVFARQVRAHGRPGDVLLTLSTSGRSPNLVAAAEAALEQGMTAWAMTGPGPTPLGRASSAVLELTGEAPAVQEAQLVALHVLCELFDLRLAEHPVAADDEATTGAAGYAPLEAEGVRR